MRVTPPGGWKNPAVGDETSNASSQAA